MKIKQLKTFSVTYSIFAAVLCSCVSIPSQHPLTENIFDNHGGADIYAGPSESELVWTGHKTPFERTLHRPYLEARCYQLKHGKFYDSEIVCRPKQSINRMVYFHLEPKPIVTYEVLELENIKITYPVDLEEFTVKFGTWLNSVKPQFSKGLEQNSNTFKIKMREREEADLEFISDKLQLEPPTNEMKLYYEGFAFKLFDKLCKYLDFREVRVWKNEDIKNELRSGKKIPCLSYDPETDEVKWHWGLNIPNLFEDEISEVVPKPGCSLNFWLPIIIKRYDERKTDELIDHHKEKALEFMDYLSKQNWLISKLHTLLLFATLHEVTEYLLIKFYLKSPDRRWFLDGYANFLALQLLKMSYGNLAEATYTQTYNPQKYGKFLDHVDLLNWPAAENENDDSPKGDLEVAHYYLATETMVEISEAFGDEIFMIIFKALKKEDIEETDMNKVYEIFKEHTGKDMRAFILKAKDRLKKQEHPLAYKLATIDMGKEDQTDYEMVAKFQYLLEELSITYGERQAVISDMTIKAQELLRKEGVEEDLLSIMEGMSSLFSKPMPFEYCEYTAAYMSLRTKYPHSDSIKMIKATGLHALPINYKSPLCVLKTHTAEQSTIKGVEYGADGKFREAKEEFEKALVVDPLYGPAKRVLEVVEDVMDQKIETNTAIHLFKSIFHFQKKHWRESLSEINKAIEINPRFAYAYICRGVVYVKEGQYDKAITDFNKAIEIYPKYAKAYNNRGWTYYKKSRYDKAISDYTKAIEINQKYAEAYYNRGYVYYRQGLYTKAISDNSKAIEIKPKYAHAYNNRGWAYVKKAQYSLAISDFDKAIELNPRYALAYNNRGAAYLNRGQYDQTISDCTKAIEINPKLAWAYANRGRAYGRKGQHDKAISDFNKAIEIDPKNADTYNSRGWAYYNKGQYDQAIEDYTKARELNPRHVKACANRGLAYVKKAQYEKAISDFNKAIKLGARDSVVYNYRGIAYEGKGQHARAFSDYAKAIEINPRFASAYSNRGNLAMRLGITNTACSDWKILCELGDCTHYENAKIDEDCE